MYVCVHNNNYYRIYSIKRRGILELRAGWRGRRLFEGGVYYDVPAIRTRRVVSLVAAVVVRHRGSGAGDLACLAPPLAGGRARGKCARPSVTPGQRRISLSALI